MDKKRIHKQKLVITSAIIAAVAVSMLGFGTSYQSISTEGLASAKITPGEAANIAINQIGAQPSDLVNVDLEKEKGSYVYSVEIVKGDQEYDVKINPQTSQVITVEQEPVEFDTDDQTGDDSETDDDAETDDD